MQIHSEVNRSVLTVYFSGEMDHLASLETRKICDRIIDENAACESVVFDLTDIRFMDSTGIGFLIGRYKKLRRYGIPLFVRNPNPAADKVLELSGIYTLIPKL